MSAQSILPTPVEMKRILDGTVIGQDLAKEHLCTAVYAHYLKAAAARASGETGVAIQKENVLLFGPTGCGKTLLARGLARVLGVPFAQAVATRLSEVGYVGDNPESIVQLLVDAAHGDLAAAAGGIIYVDEIDKLRRQETGGRDVSGQGVQHALLSIMEGCRVRVQVKDGPRELDTRGILFICTGAFDGIDDVVRQRLGSEDCIGFNGVASAGESSSASVLDRVGPDDLIRYGFMPEFIGRFGTITHVRPLTQDDLTRLLVGSDESPVREEEKFCRLHGVELRMTPDAVAEIAARSLAEGSGGRGAIRITRQILQPVRLRLPELAALGFSRVTITGNVVRGRATPHLAKGPGGNGAGELIALRCSALLPAASEQVAASSPFTKCSGLPPEAVRERIEKTKADLGWATASAEVRSWWSRFEEEQQKQLPIVLRLAEELLLRKAPIAEFHAACGESRTTNIQANLHFLDYLRLKNAEDAKNRVRDPAAAALAASILDDLLKSLTVDLVDLGPDGKEPPKPTTP